jgi:hypothetical protein
MKKRGKKEINRTSLDLGRKKYQGPIIQQKE